MVFLTNRTLTKVGQDRIWFADSQTGEEYVYPCDRVVLALGTTPTRPYALEDLQALGAKVFRVGDAAQKRPGLGTLSTPATTPPGACEAPAARRRCLQKRHGNLTKPCWSILQG